MNFVQKAVGWMLRKSIGFTFNTTNVPRSVLDLFGNVGSAEQLSVVYGCCRVRGQTIGSVPFHVYREDPKTGKREKFLDHPLYSILHDTPNAFQTSMEWRECMERSFCLWGNAYSQIIREPLVINGKLENRVQALNFMRPDRIRPKIDPQRGFIYEFTTWDGKFQILRPDQVLHVKNFSDDGIIGQSPLLRYVMEHAMAAQSFGLNFLRNGGRPSGYIKYKSKRPVSDEIVNKYKADWQENYGGAENAGKTPVLWEDSEYQSISVPPDEAQLLETAKRLSGDIAGKIYGVPGNLIGDSADTATYASAEQFALDFIRHCIRPQAVRYEQAMNKALFLGEPNVYCELDLDGLQRGDSASQAAYFSTLTQNGIMTRNEARRKLNLPEIDGADELTVQSNLIDLDKLASVTNRAQLPTTSSAGGNL